MKAIIEIFYYIISISYIIVKVKRRRVSPLLFFIVSQTFMFCGTTDLIDMSIEADRVHMVVMLCSLIVLVCSDFVFSKVFNLKSQQLIIEEHKFYKINKKFYLFKIIFLSIFSIIACSIFFVKLGYNVFLVAIKELFSSSLESTSIVEYRLNAYSSGKYLGAGYVYQFRNIILPLTTVTIYYLSQIYKNRILQLYAILSTPLAILFSLGTGQRGGFVMCFLMVFLSMYFTGNINKKNKLRFIIIFFVLFSVMSTSLGRTSITYDDSLGTIIKSNFAALKKRIIVDNQSTSVIGFRYIYEYSEIQYGKDWLQMLKDILPGRNDYTAMATKIFALMHGGSTRGTAPPSIWGSVWYNWGPIGIPIISLAIGFFYTYIYYLFISKKNTSFRIVCFSGIFVILGFWISDGPMTLINSGLITVIIMYYLIEKFNLKKSK